MVFITDRTQTFWRTMEADMCLGNKLGRLARLGSNMAWLIVVITETPSQLVFLLLPLIIPSLQLLHLILSLALGTISSVGFT